jgi:hypothetical protein
MAHNNSSTQVNGAFVDVVADVQEIVQNLELKGASADDVEAVEKAIDLAINRRFSAKPKEFLKRDVLRDGARTTRRTKKRQRQVGERYGAHQPRQVTGKRRVPGEFTAMETPASLARAAELEDHLHDEACECGAHGPRVLAGLIDGETTKVAAEAAGVSMATANRTIKRLRQRAETLGYAEAA